MTLTQAWLNAFVTMGTPAQRLERWPHRGNAEAAVCGIGSKPAGPAVGVTQRRGRDVGRQLRSDRGLGAPSAGLSLARS